MVGGSITRMMSCVVTRQSYQRSTVSGLHVVIKRPTIKIDMYAVMESSITSLQEYHSVADRMRTIFSNINAILEMAK